MSKQKESPWQFLPTHFGGGGKLDNFLNEEERNFEKKHLKNYIQGNQFFFHNTFDENGSKRRTLFPVKRYTPETI